MKNISDLNDMMVFLGVIEAGGFTLAAERLGIPKANVSRKVTRLEKQLGITLLQRTTRSQVLTPAGREYLLHCKRIHEELSLAEAAISEQLESLKGPIRVGASVGIGQEFIKPALGRFMHQFPQIVLELILENRRVDLIEEGYDMVLRIGQLDDSSLVARTLGKIQRKFYASPDYINTVNELEDPQQVCECDFLMMSAIRKNRKVMLESSTGTIELLMRPKLITDDFSVVKEAVLEGLGITILPSYMCEDEVAQGTLINVLPDWNMQTIELCALYPKHRAKIPKVAAFLDFVSEVCKQKLSR